MDLRAHPLLATITSEERARVGLAPVEFATGHVLCRAGEALDVVLFILQGSVVRIHRDAQLGIRSVVDVVSAGEAVGLRLDATDMAARFDHEVHEPVEALALAADDFDQLMARNAHFARALLRFVAARNRLLEDRAAALSKVDLARVRFDPELLSRVTGQYILAKRTIPIARQGSTVTVATASPDTGTIEADMRRLLLASRVVFLRISAKDFERAYRESVQQKLVLGGDSDDLVWFRGLKNKEYHVSFETPTDLPPDLEGKETELDGAGVIGLTNRLLGEALDVGASDIHFEPHATAMEVRYRIDGELVKRPERVKAAYLHAVLSRIKVLAGLDISEKRRPQDGRITATCAGKTVDVRVSTVPTRFGEKIVLRILDPSTMLLDLESLVDSHDVLGAVSWMIQQPYGMILVAGPTGAGKTTTVYSMLLNRKSLPVNIMTIEDPVEYSLRGVTQVQRNLHVGLDFPNAVRSFLRQDPDIIVVGETRDAETARAALEAGLTGHLVISTVHANNVFASVYRLREMGMEPFVIANSVIGVLSQRLVRRICPRCARTHQYHRNLIAPMRLNDLPEPHGEFYHFRKGVGCSYCNHKGYKGRAAVFESLRIVEELKGVIAANAPFAELEAAARKAGAYFSLRAYASLLLKAGITTPEEVSRVVFTEGTREVE